MMGTALGYTLNDAAQQRKLIGGVLAVFGQYRREYGGVKSVWGSVSLILITMPSSSTFMIIPLILQKVRWRGRSPVYLFCRGFSRILTDFCLWDFGVVGYISLSLVLLGVHPDGSGLQKRRTQKPPTKIYSAEHWNGTFGIKTKILHFRSQPQQPHRCVFTSTCLHEALRKLCRKL